MKSILEELYFGQLDPSEADIKNNAAYTDVTKKLALHDERLLELIDGPAKTVFSDIRLLPKSI